MLKNRLKGSAFLVNESIYLVNSLFEVLWKKIFV